MPAPDQPPQVPSPRRRGLEGFVIGAPGIVAALVLAFVGLGELVSRGATEAFDRAVLDMFRTPGNPADPLGPAWFEEFMRDLTALGSFAGLGVLFISVVLYLLFDRKRAAAAWVAVSVLGGTGISTLLKMGYDRPRPDIAHSARVFTSSFPSGHAMLSAVTFLTLGALLARTRASRRLRIYFVTMAVALTVIVGVSRIYLGVHFPTDVLAGWCAGAAWAGLCFIVMTWLQKQGRVEAPDARDP